MTRMLHRGPRTVLATLLMTLLLASGLAAPAVAHQERDGADHQSTLGTRAADGPAAPQPHLLRGLARTAYPLDATDPEDDDTDPARSLALPCDAASTVPGVSGSLPGLAARSSKQITHVANICGVVGTDLEFQSRRDAFGRIHDYAFLGTMGGGFRIYDITDPTAPQFAGGYIDSGWQNDIAVRGNIAVSTFDGVSGEDSTASTCLKTRFPGANGQGVDIFDLDFDPVTARFEPKLLTCVANPPGGTHTATLHPSGRWLALSNASSDWAVDVVDLRQIATGAAVHRWRFIDESRSRDAGRCPTSGVTFTCVLVKRPPAPNKGSSLTDPANSTDATRCPPNSDPRRVCGLWRPHDVSFSIGGSRMYVAALNATFIVDVSRILEGRMPTLAIISNINVKKPACSPTGADPLCDARNIQLSHQSDTSGGGTILAVTDERGGGLQNTSCNQDRSGVIGGVHFYALATLRSSLDPARRSVGASITQPKYLGSYFNPNPGLAVDPLEVLIDTLPRTERACTSHVFRSGQNGNSGPGAGRHDGPVCLGRSNCGLDGVARLRSTRMDIGWYGAGVWRLHFGAPTMTETQQVARGLGIQETGPQGNVSGQPCKAHYQTSSAPCTTWGNTLGWNVQPGSEAWSAKTYKDRFVFAGDMLRGFDVYHAAAATDPVVTVTMSAPQRARPGATFTYAISYRNHGPGNAVESKLVDTLPKGVSVVGVSAGGVHERTARTVTWRIGTVKAGATGTVWVTVRVSPDVPAGTVLANQARFHALLTLAAPTASARTVVVRY